MSDDGTAFDKIVRQLGVNSWHAQWRAVCTRAVNEGRFDVVNIGREAWNGLPDDETRGDALDLMFASYWRNTADFEIRARLDHETGVDTTGLYEAVHQARAEQQWHAHVDVEQLALLLEEFEALRLRDRHARRASGDTDS